MTKVTINQAQSNLNHASKKATIQDINGRSLTVGLPTLQDEMRYDLYLGKYYESNRKFYDSNLYIKFIKEIDGIPVAFPTKESEIIALAARLGMEGMGAIIEWIDSLQPKEDEVSTEDEAKEALKK